MTHFKVFVLSVVKITAVHFVAWFIALSWVMTHPDSYVAGPGTLDAVACGGEIPGTFFDFPALVATVVLSVPLVIPFGCFLWEVSQPAVMLLGLVNSAIWGVFLSCLLLAMENRHRRARPTIWRVTSS